MEAASDLKKHIDKFVPDFAKGGKMQFIIVVAILIIIIIAGFSYVVYILSGKAYKQCNLLNSIYTLNTNIKPIDETYVYPVNYYYIKTAYNCCSVGNYIDDYVELCALEKIISQGVRCFDFEIFNINEQPVISTSTNTNTYMKETYNSIPFSSALNIIVTQGMQNSNNSCPNWTDPVFISLRMNTNNVNVYNSIASLLSNYTNQYLLADEYNYGSNGNNFAATVSLNSLIGKMVIMVQSSGSVLQSSQLYEYTNIVTGGPGTSPYFQFQTFSNIVNDNDVDVINYAKMNTIFVTPDTSNGTPINSDPAYCLSSGIQFIGMAYQIFDNYLQAYESYFNSKGHAFVEKNNSLLPIVFNIKVKIAGDESNPNKCNSITLGDYTIGGIGSSCGCSGSTGGTDPTDTTDTTDENT